MYPKMLTEVIEALESYYCDEKDVLVDCLLYLENATCREEDVCQIKQWFLENQRCDRCGDLLSVHQYKEPHPEIGFGVYETMYENYCPRCGKN